MRVENPRTFRLLVSLRSTTGAEAFEGEITLVFPRSVGWKVIIIDDFAYGLMERTYTSGN
jgi:hypothetical protein